MKSNIVNDADSQDAPIKFDDSPSFEGPIGKIHLLWMFMGTI